MDCLRFSGLHETSANSYELLVQAATLIPIWHYLLGFLITSFVFLHIYFDFHFLQGIFNGFRGYPVGLTYNSDSHTAAWFPGVMFSMAGTWPHRGSRALICRTFSSISLATLQLPLTKENYFVCRMVVLLHWIGQ
ncbi:hypothetical protein GBA52_005349 [Prunus armeniaca]|nr:hypothetical protein GBA52_005349 [Prunus armeniaca]